MLRSISTTIAAAAAYAALAPTSLAVAPDEGMWLFSHPPARQLLEKYGFEITPEWLEHLQKSCVRVSTGGSGSIVSSDGLVMTNHHVASDILEKLSTAERNLLETGFHAKDASAELECPDIHLDVLWTIEDVTDRVEAAAEGLATAEAGAARRKMQTQIEDEAKKANGMHTEVVTLYQGGRYHLYQYKRFDDIRLVFAPESKIAFFGGDNDNFEYPRYCLDVTFFRIYEDGKPYEPEHFLRWSPDGSVDQELVFVAGHPGSTQRLNTVAHLEYLRDVSVPRTLMRLMRQEVWLQTFAGRSSEHARIAQGDLFSVQNSRKVYVGRLAGLLDPAVFAEKRASEAALKKAIAANPEWQAQYGGAFEQIVSAEDVAREIGARYTAIGGGGIALGSDLAGYAVTVVRLGEELPKPSGERLREYGDAALEELYQRLYSPAPVYPELEVMRLESSLSYLAEMLGADDELVVAVLAGKSPRARAEECIRGTKLAKVEERKRLAEGGLEAIDAANDPLISLVRSLDPESRALRKRVEDEIQSREREAYAKLSAARFAVQGESVYPDATFTLRLSYGAMRGYEEGGRKIAPFTKFAGVFRRADERKGEKAYELPTSWLEAEESIDGDTEFNNVSTCDIIGGNSGSPVVNRDGEVVGLIFDGNIQSLIGNYAYSDEQARAISVDSRGILGALEQVYDAERIVSELKGEVAAR